jgi:hypothetical protein
MKCMSAPVRRACLQRETIAWPATPASTGTIVSADACDGLVGARLDAFFSTVLTSAQGSYTSDRLHSVWVPL